MSIVLDGTAGVTTPGLSSTSNATVTGTLGVTGLITATTAGISVPTASAAGTVYSSTYTPTLTGVTNVDGTTAFSCRYWRLGSQVMVSGRMNLDTTAGAPTSTGVRISLPIASNFATAATDCSGTGATDTSVVEAWGILADTVNDEAQLSGVSYVTINRAVYFNFTYTII